MARSGDPRLFTAAVSILATLACGAASARVDNAVLANEQDGRNWAAYGRTFSEGHYSPLSQIDAGSVSRLGLKWALDLDVTNSITSPLAVDGVIYLAAGLSIVHAVDAKTGKLLWRYDPRVAEAAGKKLRAGWGVRGLAYWNDKVYVGTQDGRLLALRAATGKLAWSVPTLDADNGMFISGPPRVFNGKVVIGNGGADYGVRGFVTAFDAETGKKLWKFYTVPGDSSKGPDGEASDNVMPMATKTWTGEWWKFGGGGTVWDSFVYDPKLDLVYLGTGNGSPHVQHFRSPGGGDNLFLCSIVAVHADTGRYAWHYQMVPDEQWDFTCTQPMILADLAIEGRTRQVLMQAPKNGFFYVLDRKTGKLISAKSYVPNLWATHIDMKTGRPVVNPDAYLTEKPYLMTPTWMAAHSWHPMSYSPRTGLVYWPAQEQWAIVARVADKDFRFVPFRSNSGFSYTSYPELRKQLQAQANAREQGYLLAWDPVKQQEAFRVPYPYPGSGGVLTTAGNLLVQGTINRTLAVYRADNGSKLWEMDTQTVAIAGPMTYEMDGEQYIAANFGWGGSPVHGLSVNPVQFGPGRLMVFKLDASGVSLPPMPTPSPIPPPPPLRATEDAVRRGEKIFAETCSRCHGENARGGLKDLRFMSPEVRAQFHDIVLGGTLKEKGMIGFSDILSRADADDVNAYLVARANEDWRDEGLVR
jgi:quinohemoprotein ethanol dehydrogenase